MSTRSILSRTVIFCASLLFMGTGLLPAADLKPLISTTGKPLLDEEFSGDTMPKNWHPGGRPKSFSIVDGALQGVCPPDDAHGPSISVPVTARNLTIQFSVRHVVPGYFLLLVDGENQYGGEGHLYRFVLTKDAALVQQDRGSLDSKKAQAEERTQALKEGRKVSAPSKEQLADPKFYRTENLTRSPAHGADGKWHDVMIEICGNETVTQVDGQIVLRATGNVFDAPKAHLVFLVGLSGTIQVDHVKAWENEPLKKP